MRIYFDTPKVPTAALRSRCTAQKSTFPTTLTAEECAELHFGEKKKQEEASVTCVLPVHGVFNCSKNAKKQKNKLTIHTVQLHRKNESTHLPSTSEITNGYTLISHCIKTSYQY